MVNILHMKTAKEVISDIKDRIEKTGLKMSDLCRVMDIDQAQMSRWISGATEPLYNTVVKMDSAANALIQVRMNYLNSKMESSTRPWKTPSNEYIQTSQDHWH
jgi:transcriptional regulator with XRE-family HTH domain